MVRISQLFAIASASVIMAGVAGAGVVPSCGTVAGNVIANCSFESNNVGGTGNFLYSFSGVTAAPWTFIGRSGVAGVLAPFGNGTDDGNYDAFLQQYNSEPTLSSVSQALTLASATTYTLQFAAAARTAYPANPINILFNNVIIGAVTAPSSALAPYTFAINTAITGTTGSLVFRSVSTSPNDQSTVFDDISLAAPVVTGTTPEPATMMLLGSALLGIGGWKKFRSKSR